MVLMDVLWLDSFFRGLQARSYNGGALVFSITHPCFWPEHYGYASADWFRYERETIIESPFRISADRVGSLPSTHLHRPLSAYISALRRAGFILEMLEEPMPPLDVDAAYRAR